jgi:ribosomal protein S15
MSIEKDKTVEIIKDFGSNENDSGSADVQVAILTERIKNLTEHLKTHKKRFWITSWSSQYGWPKKKFVKIYQK